ncbi:MAG: glutamine-hydrolyzing GMP synthase, partial [Oscillospiraceae bacterium]|nr:glutamine-hydrolyzing GMP synthase [Oscillospiraceae bacterium]
MEKILVLDFGGQYNQLIARRVRECNVYCEVVSYTTPMEELIAQNPKGIIFTGGPNSVYDMESPHYDKRIFELGIPILGICYGSQLMAWSLGGRVETAPVSEYGHTEITVDRKDCIFSDVEDQTVVWMSHTDYISQVPEGFEITAHTPVCPVAAMSCEERKLYATQFHPEVLHTREGKKMLRNFVINACGCVGDWQMESFVESAVAELRQQIGDKKVILGLSGGVDSSVAAALLSKAVGKQLTCVFVDHGLMRKNEGDEVQSIFTKGFDM